MTIPVRARSWWESSATFKQCTAEKVAFIALAEADLLLTVVAVFAGFTELNPFVKFLLAVPALLVLIKGILPVIIAWIIPGRLLWPSIAALGVVFALNVKELIVALIH
jgi:hypothetical protein